MCLFYWAMIGKTFGKFPMHVILVLNSYWYNYEMTAYKIVARLCKIIAKLYKIVARLF